MSNPLDGLFRDESSSSSSDEEPESTADMILRAVRNLEGKSGFEDRWIADHDRHFFYNSASRKLISHTHSGKYLEYCGQGRYVPIADPTDQRSEIDSQKQVEEPHEEKIADMKDFDCWLTVVPYNHLAVVDHDLLAIKRKMGENEPKISFSELIDNVKIPDFKTFLEKWDLISEEPSVRHLLKLDRQLIQYVIRRFNPLRAKPKNALLKFTESLLKHPQKWRIYSAVEEGLLEAGDDCETTVLSKDVEEITITTQQSEEGPSIELDDQLVEAKFSISRLADGGFYLSNFSNENPIFLDGQRVLAGDGPCPLRDGSVVVVPHKDSRISVPGSLVLVEIGKAEDLMKRREIDPPK